MRKEKINLTPFLRVIPVGGGAGRIVRFSGRPVDFKLQGFWNAKKPDGAADWTAQLQMKFLFPK